MPLIESFVIGEDKMRAIGSFVLSRKLTEGFRALANFLYEHKFHWSKFAKFKSDVKNAPPGRDHFLLFMKFIGRESEAEKLTKENVEKIVTAIGDFEELESDVRKGASDHHSFMKSLGCESEAEKMTKDDFEKIVKATIDSKILERIAVLINDLSSSKTPLTWVSFENLQASFEEALKAAEACEKAKADADDAHASFLQSLCEGKVPENEDAGAVASFFDPDNSTPPSVSVPLACTFSTEMTKQDSETMEARKKSVETAKTIQAAKANRAAKDKAAAVAAFLEFIGYPSFANPSFTKLKSKLGNGSQEKIKFQDLIDILPPLKWIQGYLLSVPEQWENLTQIEHVLGKNTFALASTKHSTIRARADTRWLSQLATGELGQIVSKIDEFFGDSIVEEPERHATISKMCTISKDLERLNKELNTHLDMQKTFAKDYEKALSSCLRLFKRTSQKLLAMTPLDVAKSATFRAEISSSDNAQACVDALQTSGVSGATYQRDWTRAKLEAKLKKVPFFNVGNENLGKVVDALLAIKSEEDSRKEYSQMLETFKFFLHHDTDSRQVSCALEGSDTAAGSSTRLLSQILDKIGASASLQNFIDDYRDDDCIPSLCRMAPETLGSRFKLSPNSANEFLQQCRNSLASSSDSRAGGSLALAPASLHATSLSRPQAAGGGGGGGGGGNSTFEKVFSTRAVELSFILPKSCG
jgi:hypothetical protein